MKTLSIALAFTLAAVTTDAATINTAAAETTGMTDPSRNTNSPAQPVGPALPSALVVIPKELEEAANFKGKRSKHNVKPPQQKYRQQPVQPTRGSLFRQPLFNRKG